MRAMWNAVSRVVGLTLVGAILCGCSSALVGIRPSEPVVLPTTKTTSVCKEYQEYVVYAHDLQEAYHSRATTNRWWIYGAGIIGLGAVAASGGLAAAAAASVGTMALLGIGGGFAGSVFATLDNSTLADIYTIAAIRVDAAMTDAEAKLPPVGKTGDRYKDPVKCNEALRGLRAAVSDARSRLERARTDSAMAAVERALHQRKVLEDLNAQLTAAAQENDPSVIPAEKAEITKAKLSTDSKKITLTVYARLESVKTFNGMKVDVGEGKALRAVQEVRRLSEPNMWEVVVNEDPPCTATATADVPCKDHKFALVFDASKKRIEGATGLKVTR